MDILKREISRKRQQLEDKELVGVRRAVGTPGPCGHRAWRRGLAASLGLFQGRK